MQLISQSSQEAEPQCKFRSLLQSPYSILSPWPGSYYTLVSLYHFCLSSSLTIPSSSKSQPPHSQMLSPRLKISSDNINTLEQVSSPSKEYWFSPKMEYSCKDRAPSPSHNESLIDFHIWQSLEKEQRLQKASEI